MADTYFSLPRSDSCTGEHGLHTFRDKKLPNCEFQLLENKDFTTDYFVTLHKITVSPGPHYAAGTPNFMGARIPLRHSKLNLERWRHHLLGYESPELCQYLEFGFPIGLYDDPKPKLSSTMRNHGSALQYYTHIDKFISTGLELCDIVGPCNNSPFDQVHISPMMTAPKKPASRRAVYDATFGDFSLNNGTPSDLYLGDPIVFSYPKIDDFKDLILNMGRG